MIYPIKRIRSNFPILKKLVNEKPLIYLDNAATTQKPNVVINYESNYYRKRYAPVHRGSYSLSINATNKMEYVRNIIAKFINANSSQEIIFTKGTTEGINLIVNTWGRNFIKSGENIILTEMEHHANIVPWQMLAQEKNILIKYIPFLPDGTLDISKVPSLIDKKTRLLSIIQVSNVLGTCNPLSTIIKIVKSISNIIVVVDGAQGIAHKKINVRELNCDFYVFSGHKIYGPSGIGILYGKKYLLNKMPPWELGGSMIRSVNLKESTFNDPPWKFEAGSPNTAGLLGLGAAINYVKDIGIDNIIKYENKLISYALNSLKSIPGIIIYGPNKRIGIISFNLDKHHAYDVGKFLDQYGIAIRTGHQCAMPLMSYFKVNSMCRISIAMYSNKSDIDQLVVSLLKIKKLLG